MDPGGKKTYAYIRDITEKKRMEREIREGTKRFEKIAEMGEDGVLVFAEDSRIEFANQRASELIGIPKDQILGREFFSLIGKRDEEFLEEVVVRGEGAGQRSARRCRSIRLKGFWRRRFASLRKDPRTVR
jgi:PAS domain S-box-containing protein